jgi:hypothetical protein
MFGVGMASRHHRRLLGDAGTGLPQPRPAAASQAVEPLDRLSRCKKAPQGRVMSRELARLSMIGGKVRDVGAPRFCPLPFGAAGLGSCKLKMCCVVLVCPE